MNFQRLLSRLPFHRKPKDIDWNAINHGATRLALQIVWLKQSNQIPDDNSNFWQGAAAYCYKDLTGVPLDKAKIVIDYVIANWDKLDELSNIDD